jgi:hypothetical protein
LFLAALVGVARLRPGFVVPLVTALIVGSARAGETQGKSGRDVGTQAQRYLPAEDAAAFVEQGDIAGRPHFGQGFVQDRFYGRATRIREYGMGWHV